MQFARVTRTPVRATRSDVYNPAPSLQSNGDWAQENSQLQVEFVDKSQGTTARRTVQSLSPSKAPLSDSDLASLPYSRATKMRLVAEQHRAIQLELEAQRRRPTEPMRRDYDNPFVKSSPQKLSPKGSDPGAESPARTVAPRVQSVSSSPQKPSESPLAVELRRLQADMTRDHLSLKASVLQLKVPPTQEQHLDALLERQAVESEVQRLKYQLKRSQEMEEIRYKEMLASLMKTGQTKELIEKMGRQGDSGRGRYGVRKRGKEGVIGKYMEDSNPFYQSEGSRRPPYFQSRTRSKSHLSMHGQLSLLYPR